MTLIYDIRPPIKRGINPITKGEGFLISDQIRELQAQRIIDLRNNTYFNLADKTANIVTAKLFDRLDLKDIK